MARKVMGEMMSREECIEHMEQILGGLSEEVREMARALRGNGTPGLIEQSHMNTAFRQRFERLLDGLWIKVLLIWLSTIGAITGVIFGALKLMLSK